MQRGSRAYAWVTELKGEVYRLCRAGVVMAALMGCVAGSWNASAVAAPQGSCLVQTESGGVQGMDLGASCAFLGIPFAAPPVANLRWKPPQPVAPWAPAVIDAIAAPSNCPSIGGTGMPGGAEDCLKLNIWEHPVDGEC